MAINLLPTNLVAQAPVSKFANLLKKITTLGFVLFILAITVVGAYYLINYFTISSSVNKQTILKEQIKSLEQTEQKVFLAKDRLDKIKTALNIESADKNLEKLENFYSAIAGTVTISEADITSKKTEISVVARNSSFLTTFLGNLTTSDLFKTINLTSFGFNSSNGYFITVEIN